MSAVRLLRRALARAARRLGLLPPVPGRVGAASPLAGPGAARDPFPVYAAMRARGAVHHLPEQDAWLVLGHAEVAQAFRQPHRLSSVLEPVRFDPLLVEADPPAHTRVRRMLGPLFSPAALPALEAHARACAGSLLRDAARLPALDLVGGYAEPLTGQVVGRFLGLADDETRALQEALAPYRHVQSPEEYRVLERWMRDHLARTPDAPAHALGAPLAGGEPALTPAEIAGAMKLLWVAGTTTTSRLVAALALRLLQHPALRARIGADLRLLPAFVEEGLRLDAPEQLIWRVAREEVEIAGTRIPAGADVRLCVAAANRDPAWFAEPDCPVLDRTPTPHLSFGAGPHFCPGNRIARMVARVAIETLLTAWPDFRAAEPLDRLAYGDSFDYRALQRLRVTAS